MPLPTDLKNYRAPRWHDVLTEEPALVLIALLIVALVLDWAAL